MTPERRSTRVVDANVVQHAQHTQRSEPRRRGRPRLPGLREIFERRELVKRRGEYELLGRLEILHTQHGRIDFRRNGPVLAVLNDSGELVSMAPWLGLPDQQKLGSELCQACLAPCDECAGRGKRKCVGVGCGGRGTVPGAKRVLCSCVKDNRPNPRCKRCNGAGDRETRKRCPLCRGSKVTKCTHCQGTGQMSTGRQEGATTPQGHVDPRAPLCAECEGNCHVITRVPQDVTTHLHGRLEQYVALGPLVRMMLSRMPGRGAGLDIYDVLPDSEGNYMVLLLEGLHSGSRMYFHGGTLSRPQH